MMISPELNIGKIPVSFSVAGIVELDNKLLLVQEADGYGPPSGHLEEYEWLYPKSGLFWEIAEETHISPTFNTKLYGIMIDPTKDKISVGLIYRLNEVFVNDDLPIHDPEILGRDFFDKEEIRKLLGEGQIRKAKWNIPLLEAWISGKRFLFKIYWNKK